MGAERGRLVDETGETHPIADVSLRIVVDVGEPRTEFVVADGDGLALLVEPVEMSESRRLVRVPAYGDGPSCGVRVETGAVAGLERHGDEQHGDDERDQETERGSLVGMEHAEPRGDGQGEQQYRADDQIRQRSGRGERDIRAARSRIHDGRAQCRETDRLDTVGKRGSMPCRRGMPVGAGKVQSIRHCITLPSSDGWRRRPGSRPPRRSRQSG